MSAPRDLAILGAGPIGLDAALAAAAAGLDFVVYEAAPRPAGNVESWAHVRMFTPWSMTISPRMAAALRAARCVLPAGDRCPTGRELRSRLLDPVAALPAVAPRLRLGERVLAVGRRGLLKHEEIGTERRRRAPFRLLVRDARGRERVDEASSVLDCTGAWSRPHAAGDGGVPAPGEAALGSRIRRFLPDLEREVDDWAGTTVLLVGAGHSAQTAARDLARVAAQRPDRPTRTIWLLRRQRARWEEPLAADDPLAERAALTASSLALAAGASPFVECRRGTTVGAFVTAGDRIGVQLVGTGGGGPAGELVVDRVLSLIGASGDHLLYRELQVHECYATEGPMRLAAALLGTGGDCLTQSSHGAETLVNPEPGFFVLGGKSYGRNTTFLLRVGWEQVSEALSLIVAARPLASGPLAT